MDMESVRRFTGKFATSNPSRFGHGCIHADNCPLLGSAQTIPFTAAVLPPPGGRCTFRVRKNCTIRKSCGRFIDVFEAVDIEEPVGSDEFDDDQMASEEDYKERNCDESSEYNDLYSLSEEDDSHPENEIVEKSRVMQQRLTHTVDAFKATIDRIKRESASSDSVCQTYSETKDRLDEAFLKYTNQIIAEQDSFTNACGTAYQAAEQGFTHDFRKYRKTQQQSETEAMRTCAEIKGCDAKIQRLQAKRALLVVQRDKQTGNAQASRDEADKLLVESTRVTRRIKDEKSDNSAKCDATKRNLMTERYVYLESMYKDWDEKEVVEWIKYIENGHFARTEYQEFLMRMEQGAMIGCQLSQVTAVLLRCCALQDTSAQDLLLGHIKRISD